MYPSSFFCFKVASLLRRISWVALLTSSEPFKRLENLRHSILFLTEDISATITLGFGEASEPGVRFPTLKAVPMLTFSNLSFSATSFLTLCSVCSEFSLSCSITPEIRIFFDLRPSSRARTRSVISDELEKLLEVLLEFLSSATSFFKLS